MARPGQKSLNLWIPLNDHDQIKKNAYKKNITVKQYILELHQKYGLLSNKIDILAKKKGMALSDYLDYLCSLDNNKLTDNSASLSARIDPISMVEDTQTKESKNGLEERILKLEKMLKNQSTRSSTIPRRRSGKKSNIRNNKIIERSDHTPGDFIQTYDKKLREINGVKTQDLGERIIPEKILTYFDSFKNTNPRAKLKGYEEVIVAILNKNHLRTTIESFRGYIFHSSKRKDSERTLNGLVKDMQILYINYENPSIPTQKTYRINEEYL